MQQQDNKYSFLPSDDNQITRYGDNYCKRILVYCEHYLNSYIKFLVPPQESFCEHLKRLAATCDTRFDSYDDAESDFLSKFKFNEIAQDSVTKDVTTPGKICRFAETTEIPPSYEQIVPIEDQITADGRRALKNVDRSLRLILEPESEGIGLMSAVKVTTPNKICRFAEEVEKPPDYQRIRHSEDQGVDEVDAVIYIPEPFRTPSLSKRDNKFFLISPKSEQPSTTIFLPEPTQIAEKTLTKRPRFSTQVSTISVKSNTVSLYSCWPPPIGIFLISILEVILFFANQKSPSTERYSHGNIADNLMFDPYRRKEAWRFITYLFVHIGYQHLLFNLGIQVFLGVILEMVHQRWRVLTIYFAGILAGSLGTSVFNPRVKLAGASGGVYSLITAHIVTVILKWKDMQYPPTQILVFLIVICTDFVTGIYSMSQSHTDDISYIAHGCGALAGLLVGFPILRNLSTDKKTRWVQYVGLVIYLLLTLAAVIWNIAATSCFPKQLV